MKLRVITFNSTARPTSSSSTLNSRSLRFGSSHKLIWRLAEIASEARQQRSILKLFGYAIITATAAASTFLTVPFLIRLLGFQVFGSWVLLEPLVLLFGGAALLGIDHGVMKQIAHDRLCIREVIGSLLPLSLIPIALISAIGVLTSTRLTGYGGSPYILGLLFSAEAFLAVLTSAFRAADRIIPYGVAQIGRSGLNLAVIAGLSGFHTNLIYTVETIVYLRAIILTALVIGFLAWLRPTFRLNVKSYKDAVQYGSFVLLASMLTLFLDNFDRYFVNRFSGSAAAGAYVVYVKLCAIVGQGISLPLMLWFPAERFRHMEDSDGGNDFFRVTALFVLCLLLLVAGSVFIYGSVLTRRLAPGIVFSPALLLLLLISTVIAGMASPLNVGMLKPGFSHRNVAPVFAAIILGLSLAALVVRNGGDSIAISGARAISTLLCIVLVLLLSQRINHVSFAYGRMLLVCIAVAALLWIETWNPLVLLPGGVKLGIFWLGFALSLFLIGRQEIRDLVVRQRRSSI